MTDIALLVSDMAASRGFYQGLLAMELVDDDPPGVSLQSPDMSVRVHLFQQPGDPTAWRMLDDATAPKHVQLVIDAATESVWARRFALNGVVIRASMSNVGGTRSFYLSDPDGHPVELLIREFTGPVPVTTHQARSAA